MSESKRYILLPRKGFLNEALRELSPKAEFRESFRPAVVKSKLTGGRDILVIHSIVADGPKLVELDDLAAGEIDRHPDVQRLPVIKYRRPFGLLASYPLLAPDPIPTRDLAREVTIRVVESKGANTVPVGSGLVVTALSDYKEKIGDKGSTNRSGEVTLWVSGETIESLYCERMWKWGAFQQGVAANLRIDLKLEPTSEDFTDCVRHYYGNRESRFNNKIGVKVGVIDTGVDPHCDLNLIGGHNVVLGEPPKAYQDVGPHGTFVAGLIGSTGTRFPKLRGLAPGVKILSYRVFGAGLKGGVETIAIIEALYRARLDECDILNLSIESPEEGPGLKDPALQSEIARVRDSGMLVVAAAGNDNRTPVDYPAAYPGVIAVSAMGCKETIPKGAMENMLVRDDPRGTDPKEFIASFSNVGKQISVTAPGVGVLSTLPGDSFGSCSGTSFAAPVVTGAAASLLSQNEQIYRMPRNRGRSDAIEQLLLNNCITRGFGLPFEGRGMPDPDKV